MRATPSLTTLSTACFKMARKSANSPGKQQSSSPHKQQQQLLLQQPKLSPKAARKQERSKQQDGSGKGDPPLFQLAAFALILCVLYSLVFYPSFFPPLKWHEKTSAVVLKSSYFSYTNHKQQPLNRAYQNPQE